MTAIEFRIFYTFWIFVSDQPFRFYGRYSRYSRYIKLLKNGIYPIFLVFFISEQWYDFIISTNEFCVQTVQTLTESTEQKNLPEKCSNVSKKMKACSLDRKLEGLQPWKLLCLQSRGSGWKKPWWQRIKNEAQNLECGYECDATWQKTFEPRWLRYCS